MRIANIITVLSLILCASAYSMTEVVDGIQWHYDIEDGEAVVSCVSDGNNTVATAIDPSITSPVRIPKKLGGYPVSKIGPSAFIRCAITAVTFHQGIRDVGDSAFFQCSDLRAVDFSSGVTNISRYAFQYDSNLEAVALPDGVVNIDICAFNECSKLQAIVLPRSLTSIQANAFGKCCLLDGVKIPSGVRLLGKGCFGGCSSLTDVWLEGDTLPEMETTYVLTSPFCGHAEDFTFHLTKACQSKRRSRLLFGEWVTVDDEGSSNESAVNLTVTNVVVNYVLNSTQPQFAIPLSSDTGFVNVIAEVEGSAISVPESWSENYPLFKTKFGSDFSKAVVMKTGKQEQNGKDMLVWQDYVAGTDPTNPQDVFKAFITIQDGKVTVSYTPELDAERKALRKYTVWGKKSLLDGNWVEVTNQELSGYNFFKVTVEMR